MFLKKVSVSVFKAGSVEREPNVVVVNLCEFGYNCLKLVIFVVGSKRCMDIYCSPYSFFFFCVRCDDRTKPSGQWLLGSPPSAVVWQLAHRAWRPFQCLLANTVGILSPGVGRSEECAQGFAPQSHIHSGLNHQDLVSSDIFLAHSDQYADGRWWFGSSCQGC